MFYDQDSEGLTGIEDAKCGVCGMPYVWEVVGEECPYCLGDARAVKLTVQTLVGASGPYWPPGDSSFVDSFRRTA